MAGTVVGVRAVTWLSRLALVVFAGALLFAAVTAAIGPRLWAVAQSWRGDPIDLPDFQDVARSSVARDAQGNTIAVYQRQNSKPIELADVPQPVIDAFLGVEDREFYTHNGVNARALFRATVSNVASDAAEQGASTITMQVAKNEFLGGFERDLRYKLLQMHYALMLERKLSKDEILERYLNTVFFGNNAYGIEAAAETYFGKHTADLTFVESAFLAGLVQSPSAYDPIDNTGRSRERFRRVLDGLVDHGMVDAAEAAALTDWDTPSAFQVPVRVQSFPEAAPPQRTYYSEALTEYLINNPNLPAGLLEVLGDTPQQRFARLYRGGLTIETTFNPTFQQYAESARNVLPDNDSGFDAAVLSLDTRTGAVLAMVGGRSFERSEVNMALAPRQTGSAVKFFILAAALEAGVESTDIIDGTRPCTLPNPGQPDEPFVITDAVSRGPDTIRAMTAASINCAYARLAQIVGLNRVVNSMYQLADSPYLYRGQSDTEREPLQPYPALATGANEMSPLDMAAGAQTIANGGLHMDPYYVTRILDAEGNVIYEHHDPGTQVLREGTALEAVDILKDVLDYGTGRRFPLANGRPAAGKTGTQAENTNAWFVGFTPYLTTAVWVGDPNGHTPMVNVPEFDVARVQGGLYPAEIWKTYMDAASTFYPADDWAAPPAPAREPARVFLPGNECVRRIAGYSGGQVVGTRVVPPAEPQGFAAPQQPPEPPPAPPDPPPQTPPPNTVVVTSPVVAQYEEVPGGTTIPPDVLDPYAPVPSYPVSAGYEYRPC